jgi:acetyltransferase-like isoleucine patch superfamily enzyme
LLGLGNIRTRLEIRRDPVGWARRQGVTIGEGCRLLGLNAGTFGSEPFLVSLGDHVSLTTGVRFVTHDGGVWVFRDEEPDIDLFGPIRVGSNVFFGFNVLIMPGVTIGDNVVVGAGAVVTRDIPSNSVAAGVPARVIRPLSAYKEKALQTGTRIRSMPHDEKVKWLRERFNMPQP